jgi:hypothetical protein
MTVVLLALPPVFSASPQNTGPKNVQASEAKGMPPRATPADYQAHTQIGAVTLAAEFMGHSVPTPEQVLSTEDYVIVEAGLFGTPESRLKLSIEDFSLRINGKKAPLPSQPYGFVVRNVKDPEWVPPDTGGGSKSKGGISTGGNGQNDSNLPPPPVHVPIELQRAMALHVQKASLPEGERTLPAAGLIYFQYRGKTQSIHSLELIYDGPAGKATLPLQP